MEVPATSQEVPTICGGANILRCQPLKASIFGGVNNLCGGVKNLCGGANNLGGGVNNLKLTAALLSLEAHELTCYIQMIKI